MLTKFANKRHFRVSLFLQGFCELSAILAAFKAFTSSCINGSISLLLGHSVSQNGAASNDNSVTIKSTFLILRSKPPQ